MATQFARLRPLGSHQGFDCQLGAQPGQTSREFVEVDCCAGPQPFQFDFRQASQQELSEAEDMFDQGKRRLGDAQALVVFLLGRVASHLGRELFALRGVGVSAGGAPPLLLGETQRGFSGQPLQAPQR